MRPVLKILLSQIYYVLLKWADTLCINSRGQLDHTNLLLFIFAYKTKYFCEFKEPSSLTIYFSFPG